MVTVTLGNCAGCTATNVIPSGAVYDGSGNYTVTGLTTNHQYYWNNGPNDLTGGGINASGIVSTGVGTTIALTGTSNAAITAVLYDLPANIMCRQIYAHADNNPGSGSSAVMVAYVKNYDLTTLTFGQILDSHWINSTDAAPHDEHISATTCQDPSWVFQFASFGGTQGFVYLQPPFAKTEIMFPAGTDYSIYAWQSGTGNVKAACKTLTPCATISDVILGLPFLYSGDPIAKIGRAHV